MEMSIRTERIELFKGADRFANRSHRHGHWYQVTVPVQGTCHFTMENKPYRLHEGQSLIQHPGTEHHFCLDAASSVIVIKIREDALRPENDAGGLPEFADRQRIDTGELSRLFRRWTSELMFGDSFEPLAAQETETQVLHYLRKTLHGSHPVGGGIGGMVRDTHIHQVLEYMHANYAEAVSVDDLASLARQSRFHFIRSFRDCTGITPYQYLLMLRVDQAKRRLKSSTESVADISCSLGFSCTSQFHRAFLKFAGMTPGEFRRS
ncbi:hypothetical protein J2TS6_51130 [Paenibacillus albilobatus]|uniref:HTH araC/xylS-type domain-containing protein n=2 Tax=Paenibacillus TaxID=44249 RepID=A0A920CEQ2_9BACL|nr:helix-turn-helix domain-containing protein [Paenibacillus albilobatus]GIO33972.1 hypothetical protein J2TS6_51130 [Paenibacillus albilobatus]